MNSQSHKRYRQIQNNLRNNFTLTGAGYWNDYAANNVGETVQITSANSNPHKIEEQKKEEELQEGGEESLEKYIYYNYNIINNSAIPKACSFQQTLSESIIDNGYEWEVAVARLVANGISIPLGIIKENSLWISFKYNNEIFQYPLVYIPNNVLDGKNTFFSFNEFCIMMNIAFANCFSDFKTAHPSSVITEEPVIGFNSASGLFSIYLQSAYATPANNNFTDVVQIFFNTELYNYFGNWWSTRLAYDSADHCDYRINIPVRNYSIASGSFLTPTDHVYISNEFNSTFLFEDFTSFVVVSDGMGLEREYAPVQNQTDQLVTPFSVGSGNNTICQLTDFIPYLAPGDSALIRSYNYYAPSVYRWVNILQNDIKCMDLTIYIRSKDGGLSPYYIPPYANVSIKLVFKKRNQIRINQ